MLTHTLKTVREWLAQRQENKMLNSFSSAELMAGTVSKADFLSALDAPKETNALMAKMAAKRGLRPDVLENDSGRTLLMAGACSRCRQRTLCKRWLDGRAKKASADRFCPNAHHFDDLERLFGADPDASPPSGAPASLERRLN